MLLVNIGAGNETWPQFFIKVMILNFATSAEPQYSLHCINQSTVSWYFYLYQTTSDQTANNIYSVCWMVSPYKIGSGSFVTFIWSVDYSFVWLNTGVLQAGVIPESGGSVTAAIETNNSTIFNITDDTPQLSAPVSGIPSNQFLITGGANIPNSTFSTGIGMSGFATFIIQSYTNVLQQFGVGATFGVAATTYPVQVNEVLSQGNISNSQSFTFPLNINAQTATLGVNNQWIIS